MPRDEPGKGIGSRLGRAAGLLLCSLVLAAACAAAEPGHGKSGEKGPPDDQQGNGEGKGGRQEEKEQGSSSSEPDGAPPGQPEREKEKGGQGEAAPSPGDSPQGGSSNSPGSPNGPPTPPPSPTPQGQGEGAPAGGQPASGNPPAGPSADGSTPGSASKPPAQSAPGQGEPAEARETPDPQPHGLGQESGRDASDGKGPGPGKPSTRGSPPAEALPLQSPATQDLTSSLEVSRTEEGNLLRWAGAATQTADGAAAAPGVVQVWRLDGDWRVIGVLTSPESHLVDVGAPATASYRLTWTLDGAPGALAPAALQVPDWGGALRQASGPASPSLSAGLWALGSLWTGVLALGLVRAQGGPDAARREGGIPLRSLFHGVPGVELEQVERLDRLGFRTAAQLRSLDADAIAFWSRLDAATVRQWQDLAALLQWPALPAGAPTWLVDAGIRSIRQLALTPAAELAARTGSRTAIAVPFGVNELRQWSEAAQAHCGCAPEGSGEEAEGDRVAGPRETPAPALALLRSAPLPS